MKPFQLSSGYEVLKVLGEGYFGQVLNCWKKDIKQAVAVKINKLFDKDFIYEVEDLDFDDHGRKRHCNLVQWNNMK